MRGAISYMGYMAFFFFFLREFGGSSYRGFSRDTLLYGDVVLLATGAGCTVLLGYESLWCV